MIDVKNTHTGTITKGTPVFVSGSVGASGKIEVQPADSSDSSKMPAVGLLAQDLDQNEEGRVVVTGILSSFNTSSVDGTSAVNNSGDTLYVKSGGGLTVTRPTSSAVYVQNMGKIGRDHNPSGSLIVSSIMRSNDVPNLADGTFWLGNSGATPTSFSSELQTKLSSGTFSAELTALRSRVYPSGGSGTQVDIISWSAETTSNPDLIIGQRDSGFIADIHVHPGVTGKTFLHYGNQVAAGNFETQRLHTTAEGIHVGDNLGGTYTAGDQQNNQDTGFGFVVGQRIDNLGHNCVAFGQEHDLSSCSINVFAQGYEVRTTNNVKQCFGIGSHVTFVGKTGSTFTEGCMAGGEYAKVNGTGAIAWGRGQQLSQPVTASGTAAISIGYFTRAKGLASVAIGYVGEATGNYAVALGGGPGAGWNPTASATRAISIGGNRVYGTGAVGIGEYNTNCGEYGAAVIGRSNVIHADSIASIALGQANEIYGDYCAAIGASSFAPAAIANVAIGHAVKANQRNQQGYPAFGDGQVVVGSFNSNLEEHASDDYEYDFVAPLHFSVGTGTRGNRYTSIAVGPRSPSASSDGASSTGQAGFSGIIMQALLDSPSYTDTEAKDASSHVPIGGLYRTDNIVKIRVD